MKNYSKDKNIEDKDFDLYFKAGFVEGAIFTILFELVGIALWKVLTK